MPTNTATALTWTRSQVTDTYHLGGVPKVVKQTAHTATLPNGDTVQIKSVDGTFFISVNGRQPAAWADTLREAKSLVQRSNDFLSRKAAEKAGD